MASIRKISERKYRVFLSNGYMPNGKKICKNYTVNVPPRIRQIEMYVAACAYKLENDYRSGSRINDNTTLAEYAENWLDRQIKYKPATLEGYKNALRYISEDIGGIKLSDLRPIIIEEEIRILKRRKHLGKNIKDITVKSYMEALSAMLEDAVRNRFILDNPIRMIEWPNLQREEQHIPTETEMGRFVTALDEEPLVYRVYYMMAMYTGARRGELVALRWGDIKDEIMTISKSRLYLSSCGFVEGSTKNRRTRVVPVPTKILDQLKELRDRQRKGRGWCSKSITNVQKLKCMDTDYIFVNENGQTITPNCFTRHIQIVFARSGLPDEYHLHTLRHYYASYLLNKGVSSKIVADLLGHCDTGFLERTYGHAMPEISEEVIRTLEQI